MTRKTFRQLASDPLEDRSVLAGNVLAEVVGNNLTLTGDGLRNDIQIDRISATQIRVMSLAGGDATTINGAASVDFDLAPGGGLKLAMNDGNDHVEIAKNGVDVVLKSFAADFGAGADELIVYSMTVNGKGTTNIVMGTADQNDTDSVLLSGNPGSFAGSLVISTGGGNDYVSLGSVNVGRNLTIDVGAGNDQAGHSGGTIGGNLTMRLGDGTNTNNQVEHVTIGGTLRVTGGKGEDHLTLNDVRVSRTSVRLLEGNDKLTVTGLIKAAGPVAAARVAFDVGAGDDELALSFIVANNTRIRLGDGDNEVIAGFNNLSTCRIDGGAGIDDVSVTQSTFGRLTGNFLDGDDKVTTMTGANVKITGRLRLVGGAGTNTLTDDGISQLPADPAAVSTPDFTIV